MTEYKIKTTLEEADDIAKGDKNFILRDTKYKFKKDDEITFEAYKAHRPTRHPVENQKFRVTYVSAEAPIEHGWMIVGFRRIA